MDGERRALERAARQHGLLTRDQARAAGMTDDQVDQRLRRGRWVLVRRGVVRVTGAPSTEAQAVLAACLAVGREAVASHLTAARLWRLRLPDPEKIEVTTPPGRRSRLDGVRHHRLATLGAEDVHRVTGVPVTTPARTLLDCGSRVEAAVLGKAVDDALRRRLLRMVDLVASHRRRPTAALGTVLAERAPGYDPGGSDRELQVLRHLVAAGLPAPVQQHPVTVGDRSFRLDLAYPHALVAIEFDGWDAHGTFEAFHGDRERSRLLVAAGWRLVHVTARTTPADLVRAVRSLLLARAG